MHPSQYSPLLLLYHMRLVHRKFLYDLLANGEATVPFVPMFRAVFRIRPPLMFGVFAQKAQIYTRGIVRRVMLIHLPCSQSSQDSLHECQSNVLSIITRSTKGAQTIGP